METKIYGTAIYGMVLEVKTNRQGVLFCKLESLQGVDIGTTHTLCLEKETVEVGSRISCLAVESVGGKFFNIISEIKTYEDLSKKKNTFDRRIAIGNAVNVSAVLNAHITFKTFEDVPGIVAACDILREEMLEKYNHKDQKDMRIKLAEAFKHAAVVCSEEWTMIEFISTSQVWFEHHVSIEEELLF